MFAIREFIDKNSRKSNEVTGKYLTKKEATADMVQLGITGFVTVVDQSKVKETPIEKVIVPVEKAIVPNEKGLIYK